MNQRIIFFALLIPFFSCKTKQAFQSPKTVEVSYPEATPKPNGTEATPKVVEKTIETTATTNTPIFIEKEVSKTQNSTPATPVPAKEPVKSGLVEYKISYAFKGDGTTIDGKPFRSTVSFNEKMATVKNDLINASTANHWIDLKMQRTGSFQSVLGKNYLVLNSEKSRSAQVIPSADTKNIQGFLCKKATGKTAEGHDFEVFYTEQIHSKYAPLIPVNGFTLEYTLQKPNERVHFVADRISPRAFSDKDLMPKGNYEMLTAEDLEYRTFPGPIVSVIQDRPVQDFLKQDLQGNTISISDFRNKVVVINFWFTACGPCKQEIPDLNKVKEMYKDKQVEFIAITYDEPAAVQRYVSSTPFDFRIIPNARDVMDVYKLLMYPTTLIVDGSGTVRKVKEGQIRAGELSREIDRWLY